MMLGAGSFQIRGVGLSRVMPGGIVRWRTYGDPGGSDGAGETPALRFRYATLASPGRATAFVLCCGKL
jgi:hypothetical protein